MEPCRCRESDFSFAPPCLCRIWETGGAGKGLGLHGHPSEGGLRVILPYIFLLITDFLKVSSGMAHNHPLVSIGIPTVQTRKLSLGDLQRLAQDLQSITARTPKPCPFHAQTCLPIWGEFRGLRQTRGGGGAKCINSSPFEFLLPDFVLLFTLKSLRPSCPLSVASFGGFFQIAKMPPHPK